jgi:hypothetical protein
MYRELGENAPRLTNDAFVIRSYECARSMGGVALALRDYLGDVADERIHPIEEIFERAIASDNSGAMVLFAFATLIGPRVLVSLRDAREAFDFDSSAQEILNEASNVVVQEMYKVGEAAAVVATIDDPEWLETARNLGQTLDETGNAESFGISR